MNHRLVFQLSSSFVLIGLFLLPCLTIAVSPSELMGDLLKVMGMTDVQIKNFAENALNVIHNLQNFVEKHGTHWNSVKVGWPRFNEIPLNNDHQATVKNNISRFEVVDHFCREKDNKFRGNRFVVKGDPTVMLLYDSKAQLVGIQNGIRKEDYIPPQHLQNVVYVDDGDWWTRTAYFMDPNHICDKSPPRMNPNEVADAVYIQNGPTFKHTFILPRYERDINQSIWTKGETVKTQGRYYWHKISKDLEKENFVPVFPLYSGWTDETRQLMAFGWLTDAELRSPYYTNFTRRLTKILMGKQVPDFISTAPSFQKLSNIIVYLVEYPIVQANGK